MESKSKKTITSTDYNFSLLADPNKLKSENQAVVIKSIGSNNRNDSDSQKSNLIELDDEVSDVNFADKYNNYSNRSKSERSSKSSRSSNSSSRRKRYNDIRTELNNNNRYEENNYNKTEKTEKTENKYSDNKTEEKTSYKPFKTNDKIYIQDDDNYESLNEQEQKIKRMEKFAQLLHLKKNGCELSKTYTLDSNYWEMCAELRFHTDIRNRQQGVELAKDFMVYACTAIEFMNDKFDPFSVDLKGWSDHVKISKDNYTDVFSELYEKYKGSGRKIEPEVKLIFMLGASAATFHVSRTLAKSTGLESVLKDNPALLSKIESSINSKIGGGPKKSPEEVKREMEYKLYQDMMNEKKVKETAQQNNKPTVQQNTKPTVQQINKPLENILNKITLNQSLDNTDVTINNHIPLGLKTLHNNSDFIMLTVRIIIFYLYINNTIKLQYAIIIFIRKITKLLLITLNLVLIFFHFILMITSL
jgi:hypothetical protein